MDHWKLLEIEPTDDSRLIKKAYAAKLKECHPEDDPEGFMRLQEAYKQALRQTEQPAMASRRQAYIRNKLVQESCQPIPQAQQLDPLSGHCPRPPERQEEVPVPPVVQFMALLEALCADEQQRQDPAAWRDLLYGENKWPLDIAPLLQGRVMAVLKANAPLPYEAWCACNDLFGWVEPENLADLFTSEELIGLFGNCQDANISQRVSDALCKQGTGYVACGDVQAALACYKKILDRFGGSDIPEVRQNAAYAAGRLVLQLEQIADSPTVSQAEADLRQLIQTADGRIVKLALAESWLQEVLRLRSNDAEPVKVIMLCDKIIALFDKEEELPVVLARVWYNKGQCYEMLEDDERTVVAYGEVIRLFTYRTEELARFYVARAFYNKGCIMGRRDAEAAIAVYNQMLRVFAVNDSQSEVGDAVITAMYNLSVEYQGQGRLAEAAAVCEQAVHRFMDSRNEVILIEVAKILTNQTWYYALQAKKQEALAVANQMLSKFIDSSNTTIQEYVAMTMRNKSCCCWDLGRAEEAIAVCSQMLQLFLGNDNEKIRVQVAKMLCNKAVYCRALGQTEAAVAVCNQMLQRFLGSDNEAIRVQVAVALQNKAIYYEELGLTAQMLSAYEQAFQIFLDSENEEIRIHVVAMRLNQGCSYAALGRTKDALAAANQVINKFSRSDNEEIRVQVVKALRNKGVYCNRLGQVEEECAAHELAIQIFLNSTNEEIQPHVAAILHNQGYAYSKLGRMREALAAYDQLLSRFAHSTRADIRNILAMAKRKRGRVWRKLFCQDVAQWIRRSGVKLWNICLRR